MTFVGKIFVVLQLVLTIVFMGWAVAVFTAETNWKEEAQANSDQADQLRGDLATAEESLQNLETESTKQIEDLTEERDLALGKLETASAQLERAQAELETARSAVDRQTALATTAQTQSDFRREETMSQRARNARLQNQINDLLGQVRDLENTVFEKDRLIADMKSRHEQTLDELATYKRILLSQKMSLDPADYEGLAEASQPPPSVVGRVLATQASATTGTMFVEISLGEDDGFRKGNTLTVYRGGDYLGKIKLTNINADTSVGQLIPASRPRDASIQKGDNVRP